jgi:D-alanyl-D-alanine carboxypeptidase
MATGAPSFPHRRARYPHGRLVLAALLAVLVVCGLGALIARSAFTGGPHPQPARPDMQRVLDGLVADWSKITPGVTAYVAGPDGVWTGSAGIAAPGVAMAPNARLRLNSVGKTWTATLVLKLVAEHKMSLDDTVAHWLPGLLPYGNQITVRQLLRMTSGMIDTNDLFARPRHYYDKIKDPALRARAVALFTHPAASPGDPNPTLTWIQIAAALGLQYKPDTTWHYSNIGYMVVGLIAARAGGADLATLFRREIIDPLHLTSARYNPSPDITGPHAHGYVINSNGTLTDATGWTQGLAANGAILSDAADEAHFLQALMRGQILKPTQLTALKTPYLDGYGLGIAVQQDGCGASGTAYGHNGSGDGYMSSVQVSPNGSRVAVVLINGYYASQLAQDSTNQTLATTMQRLYCAG